MSKKELGELFKAIDSEPTGKLSELAKIAGLSLAEDDVGVYLSHEDLSQDNLNGANFSYSNLSYANLSNTQVAKTRFSSNTPGMTEDLKQDLISRGSIFEDSLEDPKILTPVGR